MPDVDRIKEEGRLLGEHMRRRDMDDDITHGLCIYEELRDPPKPGQLIYLDSDARLTPCSPVAGRPVERGCTVEVSRSSAGRPTGLPVWGKWSGHETICPKCEQPVVGSTADMGSMRRSCVACTYEWSEPPADWRVEREQFVKVHTTRLSPAWWFWLVTTVCSVLLFAMTSHTVRSWWQSRSDGDIALTDGMVMRSMTTVQRDAITCDAAAHGRTIYNKTHDRVDVCAQGAWTAMTSTGGVGNGGDMTITNGDP